MRVVILGAGLMGRWHATYAARAGATIAAVIDWDQEAATVLARRFGAATGPTELDIDAVHVCTPLESHTELAREALEAGRHVLCEKPLAASLAETRELLELAKQRQRVLCAVHQFPFQRGYREMLEHRARLGEVVRVSFHAWTAGADGCSSEARRAVLVEILPHAVSLLRPLELDLSALSVRSFSGDELSLAGVCGATSVLIDINLLGRPTRNELVVVGSRGTARLDLYHGYCVFEDGKVSRTAKMLRPLEGAAQQLWAAGTNLARRAALRQPAYPGLPELIREFYAAARGERVAPVNANEMVCAAEMAERVAQQ